MASAAGFEESSGLPEGDVVDDQSDFSEFGEIQRALAEDSGQDLEEQPDIGEEADIESLVENEIDSADLEAALTGEESVDQKPKKKAKGSRADKRIQALVQKNKEIEQQYQQTIQQRDQYYQQHLAAAQQQLAEQRGNDSRTMQEQLDLQRQQLDYMRTQGQPGEELTPMEKYRLGISEEASEKARSLLAPEVAALKEELDGLKVQRQQETEQAQRQQRYAYYNQQTQAVRDEVMLKGFAPDRAKQLSEPMDEMLLAFCGAFGVEPKVAAPQFKKYLDLYVQGVLETRARGGGQKIRKGRAVPKSAPSGKRSAKQANKFPNPQSLRKAGFDNALDWMAAGEPIIS